MSTREILTLQFGHYPNYVGTHWWNIQESGFQYSPGDDSPTEISHDVLYREGLTFKNEITFTPRLLLADLKGSLKHLSKYGDLYDQLNEPSVSSVPWMKESVEVKYEEKPHKNALQEALSHPIPYVDDIRSKDLESNIEVWSDFLYTRFHERTVNVVKEYSHCNDEAPFDVFNLGTDIWKTNFEDEFTDKIRVYIEECDNSQGFQLLLDPMSGFGGLSCACLNFLKDEYAKKSVISFPIIPSHHQDYSIMTDEGRAKSIIKDSVRLINLMLSTDALTENSCLTVPLCMGTKGWRKPGPNRTFRYLNYDHKLYHTSAILASALDTLTMPYRLKTSDFTLGDFCADLNVAGRKIAAASLGLPVGIKTSEDLIDCLNKWEGPLWQCITPNCQIDKDKTLQHVTLRGVPISRLKKPMHLAKTQREMPAYQCNSVKNMLEYYFQCTSFYTTSHVTTLNLALPVKMPFPEIFNESVDIRGNISNVSRNPDKSVQSVPVIAGCHSGAYIGNMLENLHQESSRIKIGRLHQFKNSGLEDDDYKECLHRILDLRDCYEESYD